MNWKSCLADGMLTLLIFVRSLGICAWLGKLFTLLHMGDVAHRVNDQQTASACPGSKTRVCDRPCTPGFRDPRLPENA